MFPVDARDMYMVTPLLFCIRSGQAALAKHLLNKGANILASDRNVSYFITEIKEQYDRTSNTSVITVNLKREIIFLILYGIRIAVLTLSFHLLLHLNVTASL